MNSSREVRAGDVVCEVMTDKVDMEVESPVDGTLVRLVAAPEDVVAVGEPIAYLSGEGEDLLGDVLDGASGADAPADAPSGDAGAVRAGDPLRDGSAGAGPGIGSVPAPGPATSAAPVAAADAGMGTGAVGGTVGVDPAAGAASMPAPAPAPANGSAAVADSAGVVDSGPGAGSVSTPAAAPAAGPAAVGGSAEVVGPEAGGSVPDAGSAGVVDPVPGGSVRGASGAGGAGGAAPVRWVSAVPLARRVAVELGVELAGLAGTGPGGVVRVVDVEAAATRPPGRSDASRPGGRRRAHAAIMRQTAVSAAVPQVTVFRDLDLTALEPRRGRLGWSGLLVRAYADALRGSPLNARWRGDGSEVWDSVAVALMVDTDRGPLAPVVADPDRLAAGELDERIARLTGQARRGRVPVAHLTAATTTVYDLGDLGVDAVQELLTPPQATLLSLGAVGPRPVPDGDAIALRTRCRAGLTVDHRVGDGADAARLLAAVQHRLDDPAWFGLA